MWDKSTMLSSNSSCSNIPPFPHNDFFFPTSPHMHFDDHHFYLHCLDLFCANHQQHAAMPPNSSHNDAVRPPKKDRHSKINTARGPRDRRMRLSLEIARKFFDLQDLLGYDKASRTVEWLLTNSGPAIRELARAQNPTSDHSSTTCEQEPPSKGRAKREKVKRVVGRATVAKESRTKARERARERTSQKRRLISEEEPKLQSGASEPLPFAFNHAADQTPPWNPCAVFSFHAQNDAFLNQEDVEIGEFEFSGKAWEDLNSSYNVCG